MSQNQLPSFLNVEVASHSLQLPASVPLLMLKEGCIIVWKHLWYLAHYGQTVELCHHDCLQPQAPICLGDWTRPILSRKAGRLNYAHSVQESWEVTLGPYTTIFQMLGSKVDVTTNWSKLVHTCGEKIFFFKIHAPVKLLPRSWSCCRGT